MLVERSRATLFNQEWKDDGRNWVEGGRSAKHTCFMGEMWIKGYSLAELEAAQARYSLRFPPDFVELLLDRRPADGWDWRTDDDGVRRAMKHPLKTLLIDLEHNDLWWQEWGERPVSARDRAEILTAAFEAAPRLIPLMGHRYIPEEPHRASNPVFSIMGSDTICYGANLTEYFANEFGGKYHVGSARPFRFGPRW